MLHGWLEGVAGVVVATAVATAETSTLEQSSTEILSGRRAVSADAAPVVVAARRPAADSPRRSVWAAQTTAQMASGGDLQPVPSDAPWEATVEAREPEPCLARPTLPTRSETGRTASGLEKAPEPDAPGSLPGPAKDVRVRAADKPRYTGLVVDCRGLDLQRGMAPRLVDPDGHCVWGLIQVDRETVLKRGIVGYALGLEQVGRAGAHPLVVRAVGREGAFDSNPVLTSEDAARVLAENKLSRFLDQLSVVFVID